VKRSTILNSIKFEEEDNWTERVEQIQASRGEDLLY